MSTPNWAFIYGSLPTPPDFSYQESSPAQLEGWTLQLWRLFETEKENLRIVREISTLIPEGSSVCPGVAYRLKEDREAILPQLDFQGSLGYIRRYLTVQLQDGRKIEALTYIALIALEGADKLQSFRAPLSKENPFSILQRQQELSQFGTDYILQLHTALDRLGYKI